MTVTKSQPEVPPSLPGVRTRGMSALDRSWSGGSDRHRDREQMAGSPWDDRTCLRLMAQVLYPAAFHPPGVTRLAAALDVHRYLRPRR